MNTAQVALAHNVHDVKLILRTSMSSAHITIKENEKQEEELI
jgi:hypothetical protein